MSTHGNYAAMLAAAGLVSAQVCASEEQTIPDNYTELGEVEVWSEPFAQKMGTQKIDNETILKIPTSNGTISELLRNNPNVQFSANDSVSQAQGEIAPENVSFHGEKFYNNSWMIDGLSNNDNINPGSNNGSLSAIDGQSPFKLPDGGTQSFWINSEIIDSVDVYDSNISSKYGQFTGGVVDAKLMSPDTLESWGSVSYRTTRDEWTNFHFEDEAARSDFEKANRIYNQPKFNKHIYSLNVNQPLSDSTAILFSYNRVESEIPFYHDSLEVWEDQTRLSETYLFKGLHESENGDTWNFSLIYSPHESYYVFPDTKNGGYELQGGGYRANVDWEHIFDFGSVVSTVAYKQTSNKVDYEEDDFYAWELTDSIDWKSSDSNAQEGGFGDTSTTKETVTFKQDYQFDTVAAFGLEHKTSFGWKVDLATAKYERENEVNIYTSLGSLAPAICYPGDTSCIAGEQAAEILVQYGVADAEVSNNHYSVYLEDQIQWKRLEVTAGLRGDFDEYLDNLDIAPRLTLSYDLFGNGNTVFFGGLNRYYSDSLLAYALSQEMGHATRYRRNDYDQGWVYDADRTIGGTYLESGLKTPFSDEMNLGIYQRIANTEWTFKWVNRKGQDQFVRNTKVDSSSYKTYWLSNDGESDADSFTLDAKLREAIEWQGIFSDVSLGANYMKVNSSFTSYDPGHLFNDDVYVMADGDVITIDEVLSRNSYNQPWTVFTTINMSQPEWGVTWSQNYRYTAGYRSWESTGDVYRCQVGDSACNGVVGDTSIYDEIEFKERFIADWRFSYQIPISATDLTFTLDVLNVFDSRVEGEGLDGSEALISYKPGRRFWLGGRYNW